MNSGAVVKREEVPDAPPPPPGDLRGLTLDAGFREIEVKSK